MHFLLALSLLLHGGTAAPPLRAHQEPRGIGNLVVPGDRVRIQYSVDSPGVRNATGTLFVRNDRMARFAALPLRKLGASVPKKLLQGKRLTYYAVIRDPHTGRSAQMPHGYAWILEHPLTIRLGKHVFGRTRSPGATAAHWAASDVGWQTEGDDFGPETFLVGRDGAIWLSDALNSRLLVSGPDGASTFPLPPGTVDGDVALGPAGTVYAGGGEGHGAAYRRVLYRLRPDGVVWKQRLQGEVGANSALRFGAGGTLYCLVGLFDRPGGAFGWMPVATKGGRPLSESQQRAGTRWPYEPLPNGQRLVFETYGALRDGPPREARYALFSGTRLIRSWRVTSATDLNFDYFTPELVGGDLVVAVDLTKQTGGGFKWEYEILRLGPHGARARFSLPRAVFGDNLLTDLRVGPGGMLYQLASSPAGGVTIYRYSLR